MRYGWRDQELDYFQVFDVVSSDVAGYDVDMEAAGEKMKEVDQGYELGPFGVSVSFWSDVVEKNRDFFRG